MGEKILGRGVFIETTNEVGDGGVEILFTNDGGVEENGAPFFAEGAGVFVGHAFEHFEFDPVFDAVVSTEKEGVGDVKEIVGGDADADGGGVLGEEGELKHALEVGVDIGLVGVRCLGPIVMGGLHLFHGEVGSFDDTDFDGGGARFGPSGEVLEDLVGVGEVGLQDDSGFDVFEFMLAEGALEDLAGEVEVAVFLHVEVDEFSGAVELAEALLNGGDGAFLIEEVDLGEDGRDLDREVGALGFGEELEVLGETVLRFFFTKDGFAEEVDVDLLAGAKVGVELIVFARKDDALAVAPYLGGNGGHDDAGKKARGETAEHHKGALVGAEVVGGAILGDESAEGCGLLLCGGGAEDFVGEVEGQFLAGGVGEEARHLGSFAFLDGGALRGEEFGGEFAGLINEVGRGNAGGHVRGGRAFRHLLKDSAECRGNLDRLTCRGWGNG